MEELAYQIISEQTVIWLKAWERTSCPIYTSHIAFAHEEYLF